MKKLIIISLCFLFQTALLSQGKVDKKELGEEPYPAPAAYGKYSAKQVALIDEFDDRQVSNLHVHARSKDKDDYIYNGNPIETRYSDLFVGKVSNMTRMKGKEPMAVLSMRGEAEELYLIRLPEAKHKNKLSLFSWVNGKMKERMTLAWYDCKGNKCVQVDSWLQDVNGDTRLDIIQKKKVTKKNGKVIIKPTLYLMDNRGLFRKSKDINLINLNDYRLEQLR